MFEHVRDPTKPYDPVIVARTRPLSVTVAAVMLAAAGVVGVLGALALLAAADGVVDDFRRRAIELGVSTLDAVDMSRAIRTALLSGGAGALALAVLSLPLARGVLGRSEPARIGALVVAGAGLACGLVRTSLTALGANVDWSAAAGNAGPDVAAAAAQAFAGAMPGWLVGLFGGLTDLQSLGYIAVAALLAAPPAREYFRTRVLWLANDPLE